MLIELDSVRSESAIEPHSFAGLMDLYEHNYMRLRKIVPDLYLADQMISSVPGHADLYLCVKQRCKYTTMLSMTYRFKRPGFYLFEPDLHLKIYHDARVVEVEHLVKRQQGIVHTDPLLEHKWTMNRFLFKWLGFCLYQGHFFHPINALKTNTIKFK